MSAVEMVAPLADNSNITKMAYVVTSEVGISKRERRYGVRFVHRFCVWWLDSIWFPTPSIDAGTHIRRQSDTSGKH